MTLLRVLLPALGLALTLSACKKSDRRHETEKIERHDDEHDRDADDGYDDDSHDVEADDDLAGRTVVPNYEAQVGDVTNCPYSGKKFEVDADSPRLFWKGKHWVLCRDEPMDQIQANPDKYLGRYLGEVDQPKPAMLPPDLDD